MFWCRHKNLSRIFTIAPLVGVTRCRSVTYCVCLDCGTELAYDWDQMRLGAPIGAESTVTVTLVEIPSRK